ncbi:hypothetical protein F8M41_024111 [Gigaspora margarita]|uniref:Uncharacterized protein n=1 Tax=Gigaspora margarita TaxID=4874 RepID=A0A8H4AC89_GIGMA|nr:hypothetical protein F8M41_024111 [Gigaspora margarita]
MPKLHSNDVGLLEGKASAVEVDVEQKNYMTHGTNLNSLSESTTDIAPLVFWYPLSTSTVIVRCNLSTSWFKSSFSHTSGICKLQIENEFQFNKMISKIKPNCEDECEVSISIQVAEVLVLVQRVKKDDFEKGTAQNIAQIHSAIESRKRRIEIDPRDEEVPVVMYGIVTNALQWYFLCWKGSSNDPTVELSEILLNIQSELNLLKQENVRLIARIAELEQRESENAELKAKIMELEYDIKKIRNKIPYFTEKQTKVVTNIQDTPSIGSQTIHVEPKSPEDKEIDNFLDLIYKDKISNKMIKRNREKKYKSEITSQNSQDQLSQASEKQHTSFSLPINQKTSYSQKIKQGTDIEVNDDESGQRLAQLFSDTEIAEVAEISRGITTNNQDLIKPSSSNDLSNTKVSIPLISNNSKTKASEEAKKVLLETEINTFSKKVSSENQMSVAFERVSLVTSNKSRPPISILPEEPKEKQKHVIKMVLKQFQNLFLKYSTGNNNYFDCSTTCPICNKDHKKENIRDNIEGEWCCGNCVNTKTYHLKYWEAYQNSI